MSGATSSAKDFAAAKAKRQKQILAVGSVILLGLLGFQLPKLMGGGSQAASEAVTTEAAAPATPTPASPDGQAAAPSASGLPDTDRVSIEAGSGQLLSFGLFKSKDPFIQQLTTLPDGSASPTPAPLPTTTPEPGITTTGTQPHVPPVRTTPGGGLTPVTTTQASVPFPTTTSLTPGRPGPPLVSTTPGGGSTSPSPASTTPAPTPEVTPTSVAISTNGNCEDVSASGTFPGNEDIFRVLSIGKGGKTVKIGVVGGAYDSGQAAAILKLNEKLTLVNTADGTRYVILLKSHCDSLSNPTPATTPTSTVAPPSTTPTATTPIVTDAFDTTTPGG